MRHRYPTAFALTALLALAGAACSDPEDQVPSAAPPVADGSRSAGASQGLSGVDSSRWITIYDPDRAWNGYTLDFYRQRIPILLDMNGRIVHVWPEARVKSRLRLLEDGSLLGIALGRGVVEYDWSGNRTWEYRPDYGFTHHDVIRLANGNTMLLVRPDQGRFDDILEVNRQGEVVWAWHSGDYLQPFLSPKAWRKRDITHINSVQEIPPNPWFEHGDPRFRPGNLLISPRELNAVFVIDRGSGAVVWSYDRQLDKQHEALMLDPGFASPGRIQIFNNRYRSFYGDRQTAVLELDPRDGSVVWQYRAAGFYSPTSGVQQPLPNGNVLVTSTRGGRTFEISRGGRIVWQWVPPFDPVRSHRYAYDHCPQLAALERPAERPVRALGGTRHIDPDAYRFARRGSRRSVRVDGQQKTALKSNRDCRRLVVPARGRVELAYGLDRKTFLAKGLEGHTVRFRLALNSRASGGNLDLFEDDVDLSGSTWRETTIGLDRFSRQRVELCVEATLTGDRADEATEEFAFWEQPRLRSANGAEPQDSEDTVVLNELTEEELEVQKKHLRALGYID